MSIVLAAFSSYVLALAKNLHKKRKRKMLMKLTSALRQRRNDWRRTGVDGNRQV